MSPHLLLLAACTIGGDPPAAPDTPASRAVAQIERAGAEAEAAREAALRLQALCDAIREPGADREALMAEMRSLIAEAQIRGQAAEAAVAEAEALLGPAPE